MDCRTGWRDARIGRFGPGGREFAEITVKAGKYDRTNTPIIALVDAPVGAKSATLTEVSGKRIAGQLTAPGLRNGDAKGKAELHFVLPALKHDETAKFKAEFSPTAEAKGFVWKQVPDEYAELSFDGKPVVRYMCTKLTDKNRNEAGKIYHHLYDLDGTRYITKGPGGNIPTTVGRSSAISRSLTTAARPTPGMPTAPSRSIPDTWPRKPDRSWAGSRWRSSGRGKTGRRLSRRTAS